MRAALSLARRGVGNTSPNPSVGCVVVKEGRVVGRAVTAPGGRPHAETIALEMAGEAARGATVYVTLEPCCHWGQTPPCTEALIAAGVARVLISVRDPDPRVNGAGIARLRAAGIAVEEGLLAAEVAETVAGFRTRVERGRPLVTLKLASTLDGRIATRTGESRWITGEAARRAAHVLRGRNDAVMVGVGTVMADDPELTCRLPGFRPNPLVRIVADSHLRTPLTARLIASAAEAPTWIMIRQGTDPERRRAFAALGIELFEVGNAEPGVDLGQALTAIAGTGINRVLVEGGAQLAASLLRADLVDRLVWFHAASIMGGDGWPASQAFGIQGLASMPRFVRSSVRPVGGDVVTEFRRAA
ncbi:MAG: bifunctional diaminohydroxyphosphoribosylaminopyrimidine deaminase/5-amino-6-(5-phosphoribosylamino)uracil reductase RibD [Acetobacteraceae bacterium]|nr:bifunctional diaminohydroxyphosphoribosylaminopyrimidine deaminase/5-amino-6-(5-phosphoribosylamino)uracil reductase RibD [Acetobacteraceae bacterium]MBV8575106.1 bifunctional diaminohydroxyphosphoribosylaminopyrimidine deaminase/5-amino-6-(5-phosphoribosylamino)uracil reductase RibD [Acetobacteraceae bacterium]